MFIKTVVHQSLNHHERYQNLNLFAEVHRFSCLGDVSCSSMHHLIPGIPPSSNGTSCTQRTSQTSCSLSFLLLLYRKGRHMALLSPWETWNVGSCCCANTPVQKQVDPPRQVGHQSAGRTVEVHAQTFTDQKHICKKLHHTVDMPRSSVI